MASSKLPARLPQPLLLTGPGLTVYQELLAPLLPPEIVLAPPEAPARPGLRSWPGWRNTVSKLGPTAPPRPTSPLPDLRPAL